MVRILPVKAIKEVIFFFLLTGFICPAYGQVTRVSGKILDSQTKEPLPFVSIVFKGAKVSTSSDFDGNFVIVANQPVDSLIFTYVGYIRKGYSIKQGSSTSMNVYMDPDTKVLDAVDILPGENPAHKILKKVYANKDKNDKEKYNSYQYQVYNKIEFDLNNIPPEYKNKKALKPIKFVFDYIDSTSEKEKPYLPLFISETVSEYYFNRSPRHKKEIIKASRISGLKNEESVTQFMGDMYQNFNMYDNNLIVFGKTFVSPISDNGIFYYKYYLIDSVILDGVRCYHIQFKQKRKQELAFNGNMWIADTSFALKQLEMSLPEDINLNYIQTLNFIQEYKKTQEGYWMLSKDRIIIDFAVREKKFGVYGRKTTSYRDYVINNPKPPDFWVFGDNLVVEKDAENKTEEYWAKTRHDSLSKNESQIYKMVDTIQSLPFYKSWENIVIMMVTGYKVWGNVELGPYYKTVSFNAIEGPRFRLGGRTSDKFSRWVEINGFVAYGMKDEKFKYQGEFKTFITKKPRQIVYLNYKDDYEILGQSWNAFTPDNIISSLFRRTPLSNMTRVRQSQFIYEFEPFDGFNNKLYFVSRLMNPLGNVSYKFQRDDNSIDSLDHINTTEVRLRSRFAWDEKYIEGTFTRVSTGTRWPILSIAASMGIPKILDGDYKYQKLVVNVTDRFYINPFGYVDYIIEAGQIFGQVPFPLLELHGGNETYIYDQYAFNMMNFYEFASDRFVTVQAFHHLGGFFFNKVPLLRRLKWREVFTAKMLIGEITPKNRNVLIFPNTLSALNSGPYWEVSAGIENIFKIFRFDVMWRMNYIGNEYISNYEQHTTSRIPKVGLRGSLQFIF
mgnify:FL=1|jgi:hypothetical protein